VISRPSGSRFKRFASTIAQGVVTADVELPKSSPDGRWSAKLQMEGVGAPDSRNLLCGFDRTAGSPSHGSLLVHRPVTAAADRAGVLNRELIPTARRRPPSAAGRLRGRGRALGQLHIGGSPRLGRIVKPKRLKLDPRRPADHHAPLRSLTRVGLQVRAAAPTGGRSRPAGRCRGPHKEAVVSVLTPARDAGVGRIVVAPVARGCARPCPGLERSMGERSRLQHGQVALAAHRP